MEDSNSLIEFFRSIFDSVGPGQTLYFKITNTIQAIVSVLIVVVDLILAYLIFKIMVMLRKEKQHHHPEKEPETIEEAQDMYQDDWTQIVKHAESMTESEWKLSVIEADKLVDEVLRTKGYKGESMGERLMSINPSSFLSLQEVWEAHKLRNLLVHDIQYSVNKEQAIRAVQSYQNFLTELGFFS